MFWNKKAEWFGSQLSKQIESLQSGDYSAIPWIFCVFSENNKSLKSHAAKALSKALDGMSFNELVLVDEQMRQTTSMEWSINWRQYSLDSFFTHSMSEEERRAVLVFASFNPNGHIRERAIREMKTYKDTLRFAILRQNDWVSQVRVASAESIGYRLSHLENGELLSAMSFVDKLSRSTRTQEGMTFIKQIFTILTAQEHEEELIAGLRDNNIRTRRICIDALFHSEKQRYDLAFCRLFKEADPFLRGSIFRRLDESGQNLDVAANRFLLDKYPLNRLLAFRYIEEHFPEESNKIAEKLLLDKSAAVRNLARYFLNGNDAGFDYSAFYKKSLPDNPVSAILGIGETGSKQDVAHIDGYLLSEQISVARAAMISVMRLDHDHYASQITDYLSDQRPGIVKTARDLIIKTTAPDYIKVMNIFRTTLLDNTKKKCLSILLTAPKWQRLIYLLEALEIGSAAIFDIANVELLRWQQTYNRSFITPSETQVEQIKQSMQRLDNKIPMKTKKELLFLLR